MERRQAVDGGPLGTVAIFAPGGYDPDPRRLTEAVRHLGADGSRVLTCLTVGGRHGRFAGDDAERSRWLRAVVDDPAIDVAMALRGGYGATRLLPSVDFDAMAAAVRGGKRFVGHSDFTALSLGLLARTGAVSFAGPMASYDFGGPSVDAFAASHFRRAMLESRVDVEFPTLHDGALDARGVLWGGNLAMLASLVGTPWMPQIDDGILFIEDINEAPYRIERMLLQLGQAGVLDRQRLVLCGDFSGYRVAPYDHDYDLDAALAQVRAATSTPLVTGLPFGHCPQKVTLAVGAEATVAIGHGRCRLQQRWRLAD